MQLRGSEDTREQKQSLQSRTKLLKAKTWDEIFLSCQMDPQTFPFTKCKDNKSKSCLVINVPWVGPAPEKNKWCETNGWKREFAKLDKMEQLRRRGPLAVVSNEKLFWKSARQMADCYKGRPVLTNFVPCKVNFRPQKLEMSLSCLPEKVGNVECRRSPL